MATPVTVNITPTKLIDKHGWNVNAKSFDKDLSTYGGASTGVDHPAGLLLDLSSIPAGSVIKKVAYHYTLYRTDNANYCKLKGAMGYADGDTTSANAYQVTAWQEIPLTSYQTKETTNTEQTISAAESAQILSTGYPLLYVYIQNAHRVYEINVDITYEPDDGSKLYVGTSKATAVYVGTTKASAVYVGTTKVM